MESFLISVLATSIIGNYMIKIKYTNTDLKDNLDKLKSIKENINVIENKCSIYDKTIDNLTRCIDFKGSNNGK